MREAALEILTSTLSDGHVEEISAEVPSSLFSVGEKGVSWGAPVGEEWDGGDPELFFPEPVRVKGQLYATDSHYVLNFSVETAVVLPCSICNRWVRRPFSLDHIQVIQEAAQFPEGVWNITEEVREALLLDVPRFVECEGGCPLRGELKSYLRPEKEGQNPFADL